MTTSYYQGINHVFTSKTDTSNVYLKAGKNEVLNIPTFGSDHAIITTETVHDLTVTNATIVNETVTNSTITNATITNFINPFPIASSLSRISDKNTLDYRDGTYSATIQYNTALAKQQGISVSLGDPGGGHNKYVTFGGPYFINLGSEGRQIVYTSPSTGTWNFNQTLPDTTFTTESYIGTFSAMDDICETIVYSNLAGTSDAFVYKRSGSVWTNTKVIHGVWACKIYTNTVIMGSDDSKHLHIYTDTGSDTWNIFQTITVPYRLSVFTMILFDIYDLLMVYVNPDTQDIHCFNNGSGSSYVEVNKLYRYANETNIVNIQLKGNNLVFHTNQSLYIAEWNGVAFVIQAIYPAPEDIWRACGVNITGNFVAATANFYYIYSLTSLGHITFAGKVATSGNIPAKISVTLGDFAAGCPTASSGNGVVEIYTMLAVLNAPVTVNSIDMSDKDAISSLYSTDFTGPVTMSSDLTVIQPAVIRGNNHIKYASLIGTTSQNILDLTDTKITTCFNSDTRAITCAEVTLDYTNSRIVCRDAGFYMIYTALVYAASASGIRRIEIKVNGTAVGVNDQSANNAGNTSMSFSFPSMLNAGDYVELFTIHGAGSTQAVLDARLDVWLIGVLN
jgi:hypothetical protein